MNVFKMFKIAIKNCKQNLKVCFLYGTLITFAFTLITSLPDIFENLGMSSAILGLLAAPFTLASSLILPSITTLPVITALTKPSADGPYTFKERFNSKFLPFTLLNILFLLIFGIAAVFLAIFGTIYIVIHSYIGMGIGLYIAVIIFSLIILAFAIITEMILMYSYIALATENIKISSAFAKGFKMFFNNFFRGIGHYLFFGLATMFIPIVFIVLSAVAIISGDITMFIIYFILTILFISVMTPVFTSCMVESYRKNWLSDNNIPFKKEETEEEIFETPDDETIYL